MKKNLRDFRCTINNYIAKGVLRRAISNHGEALKEKICERKSHLENEG